VPTLQSGSGYGVDGCRGGWFFFHLHGETYQSGLIGNIEELPWTARSGEPVLIDMPIGLTPGAPPVRACDVLARRALGRRASSVFSAPCRAALGCHDYGQASALNQDHTGRRLSRQTWGLVPKIRELDRLLLARSDTREWFQECHPELCFFGLAGGRPLQHYKKTAEGFEERLTLLRNRWPPAPGAVAAACQSHARKHVGRDDVVDALALAVAASLGPGRIATLPDEPETDAVGLPMRIVYPRPAAD